MPYCNFISLVMVRRSHWKLKDWFSWGLESCWKRLSNQLERYRCICMPTKQRDQNPGLRSWTFHFCHFTSAFYLDQHRVGLACLSPAPDPPHHGKGITAITAFHIYKTQLVRKRVCALFRPIFIFNQGGRTCAKAQGAFAKKCLELDKNFSPNICYFVAILKFVAN